MHVLSEEVAKFLSELVNARTTILINGAPESGRTTLLNVLGGEISGHESTAIIDDRRELTLRRRPGVTKLPVEFDDSGRERRLVEAALGAGPGRLVLNEVLEREIVDAFSAVASRRVSVLACVPPTEARSEPRAVLDALLLLLRAEGLQTETAVELVGRAAPVVVQTERLEERQQWRVARVFSIAKDGAGELIARDLWKVDPVSAKLRRTTAAFGVRLHGATSNDDAARTRAEAEADAQRRGASSRPPEVDPFETGLNGTRMVAEWIRSDVPMPVDEPERECAVCYELTATTDGLERAGATAELELRLARWREALHRGLHRELRLVFLRHADKPAFTGRLLHPRWNRADGRPILRDPVRRDTRSSQAFYCFQRYQFGVFTAATMRHLDANPRLRLHDDRRQIMELSGVGSGYRGQGARGTVWVLRMAGFPDDTEEGQEFSRLERFVFDDENRAFSLRWNTAGWWETL